jgi:hypothetical protein
MPFAFDAAAPAPPGPVERPADAASIEAPSIVTFDSETTTSGTPPVTQMAPVDWIASDLTTMRFTVLPSGCVTGLMGLEKQSCSGAVASVLTEHDPDTFSSRAIRDTPAISERLTFDGWNGNAAEPLSTTCAMLPSDAASMANIAASSGSTTSASAQSLFVAHGVRQAPAVQTSGEVHSLLSWQCCEADTGTHSLGASA